MKLQSPPRRLLAIGVVLLALVFLANVMLGSVKIPPGDMLSLLFGNKPDSLFADIVWQFRLPKAITCVLAGSALAAGGLLMQTLFRNPLAGPDVLGLSSGASLFVAVVILAGTSGRVPVATNPWSIAVAAAMGSALVFLGVMAIARRVRDNVSLLIIGLMIGAATSSIVSMLQFLSKADDLQAFMIWTLGSVGGTGWREIRVLTVVVLLGTGIAFRTMKSLNTLLLGENYARSLGVSLPASRFWIVLATSVMTGAVTAFCGPIAFVGLAVPHLMRILFGTHDHKVLLPATMIGGATLLLMCDVLAQLPGNTQVLPLNAITSLIGAPLVIWMLMGQRKNRLT